MGGGDARVGGYQTLITGLEKNYANVVHFSRGRVEELKEKNVNIFKNTQYYNQNLVFTFPLPGLGFEKEGAGEG